MGSILNEVIGPYMVGMFRQQPNAEALIQRNRPLLCPFLQDFKASAPPET
jgi:hypothetical protein